MAQKPSIPKGTRDFLPAEVERRNYLFETIKKVFKKYGFGPIETPSFELSSTLMGKYGEEGDRLIFRILNSGDFLKKEKDKIDLYYAYVNCMSVSLEKAINFIKSYREESWSRENRNQVPMFDQAELLSPLVRDFLVESFTNNFPKKVFQVERIDFNEIFNNIDFKQITQTVIDYLFSLDSIDYFDTPNTKEFKRHKNFINEVIVQNFGDFNNVLVLTDKKLVLKITEKALRYDLTVPFARFVVQHQNDLTFPFKRYQIQPVWRADRPQHGRYQEFFQCDADVVGSDSLLHEVDLIFIFDEVLSALKIPDFTVKINNRKILSGIAEISGEADKIIDITVAIDKLDKIGEEGVIKELTEKGVSANAIEIIKPLFTMKGNNRECMETMKTMLASSEVGLKGIEELTYVLDKVDLLGLSEAKLEFDVTLARGLNYYTGAIFEVAANGIKMGSICGGGRYDDLTGLFGMKGMSGVGISFGADRIYDVLNELDLFPKDLGQFVEVLFVNFGEKEQDFCLPLLKELRERNVACEMYPSSVKLQKQMKYANDKNIPYVAIVGESELESGNIVLKNMETGEQVTLSKNELLAKWQK